MSSRRKVSHWLDVRTTGLQRPNNPGHGAVPSAEWQLSVMLEGADANTFYCQLNSVSQL